MSVPKNHRTENKLQALKETLDMVKYTIQMCENEKIFPKKCRWNLCSTEMLLKQFRKSKAHKNKPRSVCLGALNIAGNEHDERAVFV